MSADRSDTLALAASTADRRATTRRLAWSAADDIPTAVMTVADWPVEGTIRCRGCDSEWEGTATAPSMESLYDVLNRMLWEHADVVHRTARYDGTGDER